MIVLRKPCTGSSPATYPTYFPFITAFFRARPPSDHVKQRAVPSPYARHPLHLLFTAPSPDIEDLVRSLILAGRYPDLARCYSWLAQLTKRGWGTVRGPLVRPRQ